MGLAGCQLHGPHRIRRARSRSIIAVAAGATGSAMLGAIRRRVWRAWAKSDLE
jgi:hypothetical protein